jgi:type IV pilus assembly protein PilC
MFGGGIGMMVTVMPKLTAIFEGMGAELPWQTRVIIAASDFFVVYWWIVVAAVIGFVIGIIYYGRTKQGRIVLGFIKLRIPVFGTMFKMMYIVQMMRSLHTLLIGGVTLVDSLEIVKDVVDDHSFEVLLDEAKNQVNDGHPLAEVLAKSKLIPAVVSNMVDIGEQSGRMDEMLERVSAFYQKELDAIADNIMVLIEPIIMVALGVGVGIMVSAIFVPLYNLPGF